MPFLPYLNLGGNCREAFTQYQKVFGGELVLLDSDSVPSDGNMPAEFKGLIIHAALKVGDGLLMASDAMPGQFQGARDMWVNYGNDDTAEAERVFNALAEGGSVTQPFEPTFFSKGFGTCVDRFGTPWMVVGEQLPPPGA